MLSLFDDGTMDAPSTHLWRRHLRFRTRALIIVVLAIGIWLACVAESVREQRRVKEMILSHDGRLAYEFEPPTVTRYTRKTFVPFWLRRMIGEDYFHDVTWVRIEGARFGDAELERLKLLDRIESLGIVETAITDAGLRHLRGRTRLNGLFLGGNGIGDAGVDSLDLATMPQLEVLEIRSTLVSDAKIAEIKRRFPKLLILADGPSHRYNVSKARGSDGPRNRSGSVSEPRRRIPQSRFGRPPSAGTSVPPDG
jgi:hypothetical protein